MATPFRHVLPRRYSRRRTALDCGIWRTASGSVGGEVADAFSRLVTVRSPGVEDVVPHILKWHYNVLVHGGVSS